MELTKIVQKLNFSNFSSFTHVIYLVRDPRAVLDSLSKPIARTEFKPVDRSVHTVCEALERDLDELVSLQRRLKTKQVVQKKNTIPVFQVRYEDLVKNPMEFGKQLVRTDRCLMNHIGNIPFVIIFKSNVGELRNRHCFFCFILLLDQIFFCDPIVIESICYRTRAKRLINEGNTTGRLRKIRTGYP